MCVVTDSSSPIVVVLSGSMEPAFQRGDLLFLWNRNLLQESGVGEVVVYNIDGKDIPIVHRIVRKFGTGYVSVRGGYGLVLGAVLTCLPFLEQTARKAPHKRRQQRGRRHRPVCAHTRLPRAEGHCGQRRRLRAVHRLRDHHADRTPVDEDGDAWHHGSCCGHAAGVAAAQQPAFCV